MADANEKGITGLTVVHERSSVALGFFVNKNYQSDERNNFMLDFGDLFSRKHKQCSALNIHVFHNIGSRTCVPQHVFHDVCSMTCVPDIIL